MAKQSALELKREEARDEILAMKEKIPTAKIFNLFDRAFGKRNLGYWLISFIGINLIVLSPWFLIGWVLDELSPNNYLWTPATLVVLESVGGFFFVHLIALNVFSDIAEKIIPKINNVNNISEFIRWFNESWSGKLLIRFVLFWIIIWVLLETVGISVAYHNFIGFGLMLTTMIVGLILGIGFHMIFWVGWLAFNLRKYQYDLNTVSPADSEIVKDISSMLTKCIYLLAIFWGSATLINSSSLMNLQMKVVFMWPFFLIAWVSISVQFLITRSTLSTMVENAKWTTLNKIQTKINRIESKGDLSDKETSERLLRLADIHKRILASKSQVFDLKSVSTLFSQLMLPLLGLLLGNLDKIRELLMK